MVIKLAPAQIYSIRHDELDAAPSQIGEVPSQMSPAADHFLRAGFKIPGREHAPGTCARVTANRLSTRTTAFASILVYRLHISGANIPIAYCNACEIKDNDCICSIALEKF
jgi:hypothetical protein